MAAFLNDGKNSKASQLAAAGRRSVFYLEQSMQPTEVSRRPTPVVPKEASKGYLPLVSVPKDDGDVDWRWDPSV